MEPPSIKPKLQAVLVATRRLVAVSNLAQHLGTSLDEVEEGLLAFEDDLRKPDCGLRLERKRGAVGINVKPKYEPLVARLFPLRALNLTADSIETLAVIALMQPITTRAIAMIRHVEFASVTVRKMARRGLIAYSYINGARHWHVTQAFLDRFDPVSSEELRDNAAFGRDSHSSAQNMDLKPSRYSNWTLSRQSSRRLTRNSNSSQRCDPYPRSHSRSLQSWHIDSLSA